MEIFRSKVAENVSTLFLSLSFSSFVATLFKTTQHMKVVRLGGLCTTKSVVNVDYQPLD